MEQGEGRRAEIDGLIFKSLRVTRDHWKTVSRLSILPLLVLYVLMTLGAYTGWDEAKGLAPLLFGWLQVAVLIPFMAAWYRYVLALERGFEPPRENGLRWGAREKTMGIYLFVISMMPDVILRLGGEAGAGGSGGGGPGGGGEEAAAALEMLRYGAYGLVAMGLRAFVLVLPASAVGEPTSLGQAWAAIRGVFIGFVLAYFALTFLIILPLMAVGLVMVAILPGDPPIALMSLLAAVFTIVVVAIFAAFEAMVYGRRVPAS